MKRLSFVIVATFLMISSESLGIADEVTVLKWTGCGITKKAFMAEAAKAYEEETGGKIVIKISGGGATKGIRFADAGLADMGGNCRPALPDKFPEEESNARMTVVGWDALVPIINPNNPIESITSAQLKNIMTGEITNWSEVGGPDQKIQVVARIGKVSGVGFTARQIIFEDEDADYVQDAIIKKSSGPVEKHIEKNTWAIGITGISSAKRRKVKVLSVDGNESTEDNIASGAYPTFRPLYITTNGEPTGEVKKFLDWLTSEKGQAVVTDCGTVTLAKGKGLKEKYQNWVHTDHILNYNSLP